MTRGVRLRDPDALRAYVRLMGLSERALAARAGVSHATLNHLLSGRRTTCRPSTAWAIEAALACPRVSSSAIRTRPSRRAHRTRE